MFTLYDKIKLFMPAVLLPLLFIAAGCAQDSILDDISHEVAPTKPLIKGGPSKMIKAAEKLYVANGNIFEYDLAGNGHWERSAYEPGGNIKDLAVASGSLYALSVFGTELDFRVFQKSGNTWTQLEVDSSDTNGYTVVQSIFGAGDQLFAGASKGTSRAILYKNGNKLLFLTETKEDPDEALNGVLTGAGVIDNVYYLGTLGDGILKVTFAPPAAPVITMATLTNGPASAIPQRIAGFLQPDSNHIIAASRNGNILYGTKDGFTITSLGGTFTGALTLAWAYDYTGSSPVPGTSQLLLIGINGGTSYANHGYREVLFDINSGVVGGHKNPGGDDPTSIAKNGNYGSTLERYPVTSICALEHSINNDPDSDPIMFASTPKEGLYSYRNRSSGGWQWNHEEKN
ncbi:hypothetical protein LQZ19_08100 [Treponema primitia]|uniref:hypothetical protein n=1 Tax=Treponema primitia TaxID=88058 RepID=UPI00397F7145